MNLITLTNPQSAAAEAYRTLRTNLYFATLDAPLKTIVVTSPAAGEDKTTVLANLAVVMAQAGKKVIAVDADLRHPTLHEFFSLKNEHGLGDVLTHGISGGQIPLSATSVAGLSVLTSGAAKTSPLDLLDSPQMRETIKALISQADIVLFDSAPMIVVSDTAILASQTDGVLMVVEMGRTRRAHVQEACDLLNRAHARLLGAVTLNSSKDRGLISY
jgi:capsular exopolysaccharide synthesis family protein